MNRAHACVNLASYTGLERFYINSYMGLSDEVLIDGVQPDTFEARFHLH